MHGSVPGSHVAATNHPVLVTLTPSSGRHRYCIHMVFESMQTKHSYNLKKKIFKRELASVIVVKNREELMVQIKFKGTLRISSCLGEISFVVC